MRAAESGSFSRAGRELGLSQPVGVPDHRRTGKRGLGVTLPAAHHAQDHRHRCRRALSRPRPRNSRRNRGRRRRRARRRFAARNHPPRFARTSTERAQIIPRLPKFLNAHPLLRFEMAVADARQDLVAEGSDVAVRLGELNDSVFGARKLQTLERMLVASPAYLKVRGTPKTPADLAAHDCIFGPGNFGRDSWSFKPQRHRNIGRCARPHSPPIQARAFSPA
ncbi:MAG: LysR substrate-binding domain-containing protein [Bradyrhizobium sp.]